MLQDFFKKKLINGKMKTTLLFRLPRKCLYRWNRWQNFVRGMDLLGYGFDVLQLHFLSILQYVIHDIMYIYMVWYRSHISFVFSEITIHTSIWSIIGIIDYFPQNHQDVVRVALAIADNGRKMKQFTDVLAKHCVDQR